MSQNNDSAEVILPVAILEISNGKVSVKPLPNTSADEKQLDIVRAVSQRWLDDTFVHYQIWKHRDNAAAERLAEIFGGTVTRRVPDPDTDEGKLI